MELLLRISTEMGVWISPSPSSGANTLTILLGTGSGTFTQAASPVTGSSPVAVAYGDFNQDGKIDLTVANSGDNTVSILLGNGDGTFVSAPNSPIAVGLGPGAVAVGDFNRDGSARTSP